MLGITTPALTSALPQISTLWGKVRVILLQGLHEDGAFGDLSHRATAWSGRGQSSSGLEELDEDALPAVVWQQCFSDPTQWWDNRTRGTTRPASTSLRGAYGLLAAERLLAAEHEITTCRKLCEYGHVTDAVDALDLLVQRGCYVDNYLFFCVLKRCTAQKDLILGRRIHALTVTCGYEGNAFLATHLIGLYASHGLLEEAMEVFSKVSKPSAHNWTNIILAYARHGEPRQAIRLYGQMRESTVQPGNHIFVAVLNACSAARDLAVGKDVHSHIRSSSGEPNIFVQNCLVDMYAKCGSVEDARRLFDGLPHRNVVTWTAMMAGYVQQGMGQEALQLYKSMQEVGITPDSVAFVCLLQACAGIGEVALHQGMQLHAQIDQQQLQDDVVVGASLVNMYAKCGRIEDARRVFDMLPQKNVVTWNAMIAGYCQQSMGQEALSLYRSMEQEGIAAPDSVTFVLLLQACASVGEAALPQGKQLQAQMQERVLKADVTIGNSLVNMYTKCGSVEDARSVFEGLSDRNVVTWTVIIACYAQQGMGQEALTLYTRMQQECITPPDAVTYVTLLQACATVTALPFGKQLHAQIEERGMQADVVVGTGLVHMYAKCGSMVDSQQVFDSLSERDVVAWGCLIAGYACQGDSEAVFNLVGRMTKEGVQPNAITFLSVLTVCSHVGLVDKARNCFQSMRADYGITPTNEHYTCMMDLLGRAGYLQEALEMAKAIPFPPKATVWLSLLGACQKWNNVEIGQQAFEYAVCIDEKDSSAYALMSNIYAGSQMWQKAKEMHVRRVKYGAVKPAAQSWWTDMRGVVHTFLAGDKGPGQSEGIYTRLEQLVPKMTEKDAKTGCQEDAKKLARVMCREHDHVD